MLMLVQALNKPFMPNSRTQTTYLIFASLIFAPAPQDVYFPFFIYWWHFSSPLFSRIHSAWTCSLFAYVCWTNIKLDWVRTFIEMTHVSLEISLYKKQPLASMEKICSSAPDFLRLREWKSIHSIVDVCNFADDTTPHHSAKKARSRDPGSWGTIFEIENWGNIFLGRIFWTLFLKC